MVPPTPTGADERRGALREGDRVQLTDPKGRHHTIVLAAGKTFHTHRGQFHHDELIGAPEGSVVRNTAGVDYVVLRPLLSDFVLSMPRGAAVVYPKDAGQIVQYADIYPGARVVEAGVGSGALTMSLLRAVGDGGSLVSIERREDFADIAQANVEGFFGGPHPAWSLLIGDFDARVRELPAGSVDRVVLDMLAPWENLEAAGHVLAAGGVFLAYVATTTQLSRLAEDLKDTGDFTEPRAWETMARTWHLEGLAVRPDHRMVGHTGFLLTSRRMAPGTAAPLRHRRPAKGSQVAPDDAADAGAGSRSAEDWTGAEWSAEELGERPVSEKKIRKVRRDVTGGASEPRE